jgi:hypothetical protein
MAAFCFAKCWRSSGGNPIIGLLAPLSESFAMACRAASVASRKHAHRTAAGFSFVHAQAFDIPFMFYIPFMPLPFYSYRNASMAEPG